MAKDLRIEKTEAAVEQAFLELIEVKGFVNVHLVDIAKKANVNRNTIYLRYGTKEDIITSILNRSFQSNLKEVDVSSLVKNPYSRRNFEKLFLAIFNALNDEMELYRIVLTDPNLSGYLDRLLSNIRKISMTNLQETKKNKVVAEYILQGIYGVIKTWIIYDTGSIEENVKILTNLVMSNLRHLAFIH